VQNAGEELRASADQNDSADDYEIEAYAYHHGHEEAVNEVVDYSEYFFHVGSVV